MTAQPDHLTALVLPIPERHELTPEFQKYFAICDEKLGMVPNVLKAYSQNAQQLEAFSRLYNELMFGDSELTELEKEMIAVVASAQNHCYYCQVAHGAAVREYSGDPALGELLVMNYRVAELSARQRAMLDFTQKLTETRIASPKTTANTCATQASVTEVSGIIANIIGFYNMTNRVASAVDMQPNPQYHSHCR